MGNDHRRRLQGRNGTCPELQEEGARQTYPEKRWYWHLRNLANEDATSEMTAERKLSSIST